MKTYIENRVKDVAGYILATHSTIRQTGRKFGVSKSTIEKDVQRLAEINPVLQNDVRKVLEGNWNERHIRGGRATKVKYGRA